MLKIVNLLLRLKRGFLVIEKKKAIKSNLLFGLKEIMAAGVNQCQPELKLKIMKITGK